MKLDTNVHHNHTPAQLAFNDVNAAAFVSTPRNKPPKNIAREYPNSNNFHIMTFTYHGTLATPKTARKQTKD
jgi:hypothetical protein